MSDGATTGIDPRFDPRYQRGYAGHGSDTGEPDAAAPPVPEASKPARVPEPPASVLAQVSAATDPAADSPATVETPRSVPGLADADADPGPGAIARDEPVFELDANGGGEPESHDVRWWFAAAWAVLGISVVIGIAVTWAVNSDPATYTGIDSNDLLRQMSWVVAPNLVRFGLIGTVGLTVWIGVRQVRAQRARVAIDAGDAGDAAELSPQPSPHRLLPRVRAVPALFGLIGAGVVVFIWWAGVSSDRDVFNYGVTPREEQLSAMAVVQTAGSVVGPATETALWSVFGIIVLGASAAIARREDRAAVLSAARARSAPTDRP